MGFHTVIVEHPDYPDDPLMRDQYRIYIKPSKLETTIAEELKKNPERLVLLPSEYVAIKLRLEKELQIADAEKVTA